jgi:hypothetical protein
MFTLRDEPEECHVQMNKTDEDFGKIRTLQENLRQALGRWDAIDEEARDLRDLVPVVGELGDALRELQWGRARTRVTRLCWLGGWGGVVAGLVFLALAVFGGWSTALLVMAVVVVAAGAVLLVVGGRRA